MKREEREEENKKLRGNKTKICTMVKKECCQERFCENIGSHIRGGDPCCSKGAIVEVLSDEMVSNINVFSSGGDDVCVGNGTGTLVIT